jgi:hypothetical protein
MQQSQLWLFLNFVPALLTGPDTILCAVAQAKSSLKPCAAATGCKLAATQHCWCGC